MFCILATVNLRKQTNKPENPTSRHTETAKQVDLYKIVECCFMLHYAGAGRGINAGEGGGGGDYKELKIVLKINIKSY